jgi:hypothetical protein
MTKPPARRVIVVNDSDDLWPRPSFFCSLSAMPPSARAAEALRTCSAPLACKCFFAYRVYRRLILDDGPPRGTTHGSSGEKGQSAVVLAL